MLTQRKWQSLPPKTRLRKLAALLQKAEMETGTQGGAGGRIDPSSLAELIRSDAFRGLLPPELEARLLRGAELLRAAAARKAPSIRRQVNGLRHLLLRHLGAEPAEWDLLEAGTLRLDTADRRTFPLRVYLEDIRSPFNVGSIFRTAEAFGAGEILLSPDCPSPTHRRAARTSRGCHAVVPWRILPLETLAGAQGIFALETGGVPLDRFEFPPAGGTVLIGSEELGLSPEALEMADRGYGRVEIPMIGAKRSLNVAVAFGILMWRWSSRFPSQSSPRARAES